MLQLMFDSMTDAEKEQQKLQKFAQFVDLSKPPSEIKTDNDRLRQYEFEWKRGNAKALDSMYLLLKELAQKIILKEQKRKKFMLDADQLESKAENAATYIIEQYITREGFKLVLPTSYLYLRVKHELYYKTKVTEIIDFVSSEDLIDMIKKQGGEDAEE